MQERNKTPQTVRKKNIYKKNSPAINQYFMNQVKKKKYIYIY